MTSEQDAKWYYATEKQERLEATFAQLKELFQAGKITDSTLVWTASMANWQQIKTQFKLLTLLTQNTHDGEKEKMEEQENQIEGRQVASEMVGEEWHYLNESAEQVGPVSRDDLCLMLRARSLGGGTYAWKEGMADWAPLSQLSGFDSICSAMAAESSALNSQTVISSSSSTSSPEKEKEKEKEKEMEKEKKEEATWHYADKSRTKHGPVTPSVLGQQYLSKEITKDSLVWKPGMAGWKRLSEIPELVVMSASLDEKEEEKAKKREKRKRAKKNGKWTIRNNHANVYITGLPHDTTRLEVYNHFKKAGIIVDDPNSGEPRIKIYEDENGLAKGDGCVTYLKEESVGLAIQFLNDSLFRKNVKIKVQKAEFKMKGEQYLKKKQKIDTNPGLDQNQKLAWHEHGVHDHKKGGLKIVILKKMFHPREAEGDPNFYEELKIEVGLECERKCGVINKITVFDGNPDGVIALKFAKPSSAEKCISIMNGRFFGGRQIECKYFDGTTNYKMGETKEEEEKRHEEFGNWIGKGGH